MRTSEQSQDESWQRRQFERMNLLAEVGMRRSGIHPFRVHLFDTSRYGCKIEFIERPMVGELVWVKFDGLEALEATVRWVEGHVGGVLFQRPIHEALFSRLRGEAVTEDS